MIMELCDFLANLLHYLSDLSIYAHPVAPHRSVLAGADRKMVHQMLSLGARSSPAQSGSSRTPLRPCSILLWHDDIVQPRPAGWPGSVWRAKTRDSGNCPVIVRL